MNLRKQRLHEYLGPLVPLLGFFDLIGVLLGAGIANAVVAFIKPEYGISFSSSNYQILLFISSILTPSIITWMGGYKAWRGYSLWSELRLIVAAWVCVLFALSALALMTKTGAYYSRLFLGIWFLSSLLLLIFSRVSLRLFLRALRKRDIDVKRIVIAGNGELVQIVSKAIFDNPSCGLRIIGYFAESNRSNLDLNYLGAIGELAQYIDSSEFKIDQLWIAMSMSEGSKVSSLLGSLKHSTIDIRLVPDMFAYQLLNYSVEHVVGLPVINISSSPYSGSEKYIKDITDKVYACGIILITLPIMMVIAIAIKLTSPGPIIFTQLRHGWDGKPFIVYKFRSMINEELSSNKEYEQAKVNDKRTTVIGNFLRKTSLDELPQFFNVLNGDMSVVGPRPHPVEMNKIFMNTIDRYMLRHKVKPGITGWAQVNGHRGETDTQVKMEARIRHDLYYIENWSLGFDLKIIALTIIRGFWHPNAY